VKKQKEIGLDFVIDKLTNYIENVVTGDNFATEISILTIKDLKSVTKKNSWLFDWKSEFKNPIRDIYKLTIWNLVENTSFNKGKVKMYDGVAGT
jgi:hypothetical protein